MPDQEKEIQSLKEELYRANKEIEKLSRIKSDFISVVSHELRTPLTSIKESVSLVLDGVAGPISEEQKKFLTISKNNIERLAKLIIDILDLSKLESGRIIMRKRKLNVNDIIKDVYASTKILVEQKNIEFTISLGGSVEPTWFDPDRIGQVLKNLISNAIKFNKENGKIKIISSKESIKNKDVIKITVEDNGVGIPAEDKENLFRSFNPLDASMTRKHSGTGLGLVISKGMIELHGGDIWVVSEADAGSKFIFTIPLYKKHEEFDFLVEEAVERAKHNETKAVLIIFDTKNEKDKSENVIAGIENIISKAVRGPDDQVARCGEGKCVAIIACADRLGARAIINRMKDKVGIPLFYGISVYPDEVIDKNELVKKAEEDLQSGNNQMVSRRILLIIDDEEDLASMLSFRLQNSGFDAIAASDGDTGIGLAKKNKPDLILLDLMMPKMDGFEVSRRLKADPATKHIPIVIFSALGHKNTKESMEKLGAADFIEKPFEPNLLVEKINNILEGKNG